MITCDKCGKEMTTTELTRVSGEVDLCRKCYKELENVIRAWIDEK